MIWPNLDHERSLWASGVTMVAGVDEVGRGAWAGPVVAAAVYLPTNSRTFEEEGFSGEFKLPQLLRDSKKLSAHQREVLARQLQDQLLTWSIGRAEVEEINSIGIGAANFLAMERALHQLPAKPQFVLIDGFPHPNIPPHQQQAIIKGDALVASIAAASVLAKVYRDAEMDKLAIEYPGYGFEQHKGYGTKLHQQTIMRCGLSPVHRSGYKLKFLQTGP